MKSHLIIITFFLFLTACNLENEMQDEKELNHKSKAIIEIEEEYEFERRLLTQLEEYLIAFNGGDPEIAISYWHPDIFKLMSQQSSGKYTVDEVKNKIADNIRSMNDGMKNENISVTFEIGEITNKFDLKFEKVYTVIYHLMRKKGLDEVKIGSF